MSYAARLDAGRGLLDGLEVDALLVTSAVNIRYLTGFGGTNAAVLLRPDGATFLTDFRYTERAEPLAAYMEVRQVERDVLRSACEHLTELAPGATRIGFEAAHLSVAQHERLRAAAPSDPVPTVGAIEGLRRVKDEAEIGAVRRSAALIEPVLETLVDEGLAGRRERDVAWRIQELFHEQGAEGVSFPPIVASHERGAQPHAEAGDATIGPDTLVTVDLGCILDGYCSDCTRTFATGTLAPRLRDAYAICLEAQLAAMDAIGPGMACKDADAIARDIIEKAGLSEYFGHPLGHGVGLDVHEDPRLSAASAATLEPGMVVTVEPGIYLPGAGGVRIEDLVVITGDGCERLTGYPKGLTTVRQAR
ncbi:MAG TPA: Xaa-Pro peptidase family protein [Gaiellales bacterium]|nr:Xaa-Pro peptidase family protein [Gaiellales bacterium]